jgi:hypothetical protein
VDAATLVFSWQIVRPVARNFLSHKVWPVRPEKQKTCSISCFAPLDALKKTLLPTTIGLDKPRPGIFDFHEPSLLTLKSITDFEGLNPLE